MCFPIAVSSRVNFWGCSNKFAIVCLSNGSLKPQLPLKLESFMQRAEDTPPQHEQKKSEVKQEPSSGSSDPNRYRWQKQLEDERARSAKTRLRYLLVNYLSLTHVRAQDHWSYKSEEVTDLDGSRYWTCTLHMFSFPTPSGLITHSWGWTQLQAEGYAAEQVLENAEVVDIQDNLADTMTQIKKKYGEHPIGRRQNESMRNYLTRVHSEQQFQGKRMAVFDGNI